MRLVSNLFVLVLLSTIITSFHPIEPQFHQYHHENVLGTSFDLKVAALSEQQADEVEQTALDEMDRLENIFSTYKPSSEISRWVLSSGKEQKISSELFEVLSLFDHWHQQTHGALSASISQASAVWKTAASTQRLPSPEQLSQVALSMQKAQWQLNPVSLTAVHLTNQSVALNSFVKSYIIEKVTQKIMKQPGVRGVVVNVGGDVSVSGDCEEMISVTNPTVNAENDRPIALLQLQNKFIATSGNYRRGYNVNGTWYSHIIDARTAVPASKVISATVVADKATDAGALATAFNILTLEESAALASQVGGVEYLIVTADHTIVESKGWSSLVKTSDNEEIATVQDGDFEASIDLELARFEGRFRRPFVAIWIENKKKESIRTLALWFNKPRWLPDLKRWYSKNQHLTSDRGQLGTISSATRSSGKYTLVWNGMTDTGEVAPKGRYTIYIEAAREHGTYQLIKQEIDWKGKPKHFDLEKGVEITAASIDLRVKAK